VTASAVSPGIIVGLAAEERLLRRAWPAAHRPPIACAGASGERAAHLARALVEAGSPALVSLGLAGGLDPALSTGTLLLCDAVVLPDGARIATDIPWRERLASRLRPALSPATAALAGCDTAIASKQAKAVLHRSSGAVAVDMESHGVARVAAERGVPFLVLRVIADPADQAIPPAALSGLAPDGKVAIGAVLGALARDPSQIPDLLRLARQSAAAMGMLRRAVTLAGPDLGFV
jgi:hopanoid-associated phosphorylase